jgi:hypothetical protein
MAEVKYNKSHHAGGTPEARLAARERNSGCDTADHIIKPMQGARFHNIHERGQPPASRRVNLNDGGKATLDKDT